MQQPCTVLGDQIGINNWLTDVFECILFIVENVESQLQCNNEMECDSLSFTWLKHAVMLLTCETGSPAGIRPFQRNTLRDLREYPAAQWLKTCSHTHQRKEAIFILFFHLLYSVLWWTTCSLLVLLLQQDVCRKTSWMALVEHLNNLPELMG